MGYSNIAGDLNVYTSTSTSTLTVRNDTTLLGNLTATAGFHTFGNVAAGNLVVTGNFTVTATNTQVSNALSINNAGTSTALKVVQYEGGGPGHVQNVAEFWDFHTLAMVIDAEGNVGIHTTSSPNYSLTVGDGAYITNLTLANPLQISSGGTGATTSAPNFVFAGPFIGSAAPPSFRALVNTDLPSYISVSNISANGSALSSLTGANVTGNVDQATLALVVSQASQPNITSVGTLTGLTVSGILSAGLYVGNASGLSNLNSSNLVGNVANANVALVVSQASQPNITSVGTLTGLTVSGILSAGLYVGNASGLSNLNSSNLVGNVANANVALVVSQASQPNITSVGTLTGLTVSGILSAGLYVGNASGLSNLNSSNLVGNVANANVALVVSQASQPNITSVGTLSNLVVSNSVTTTNVFVNDLLTVGGLPGLTSLDVTGNVFVSNAVTTTNVYLRSGVTNSTAGQIVKGALEFNGTTNVFYGTSSTIRGLIPVQYFYQLNADTALGTTTSATPVPAFPGIVNGVQLQIGRYYMKMLHVLTLTTSSTAGNTSLQMAWNGGASVTSGTLGIFTYNVTSTTSIGNPITVTTNTVNYFTGVASDRVSSVTTATSTATTYYTTIEGTFTISAGGAWYPVSNVISPGTFTATPGVRRASFIYVEKIGDTGVDVNIGGWS